MMNRHHNSSAGPSDRDLIIRFRDAGDSSAFDELVQRYDQRLVAVIKKRLSKCQRNVREIWEDIRQEVWIRISKALKTTFSVDREFAPYLWQVTRSVCSDQNRKWRREEGRLVFIQGDADESPEDVHTVPDAAAVALQPTPRDFAIEAEHREMLRDRVSRLDPSYRKVMVMRYWEEMSVAEIAHRENLTCEGVKTRLRRGTAQLRAMCQSFRSVSRRLAPPGDHRRASRSRARRTAGRPDVFGQRLSRPGRGFVTSCKTIGRWLPGRLLAFCPCTS
ncbi:MAG: sigma-70 family RNA polymerase sigma factor [Candidatus Sumerlaeaceae bacterium]|nr:sigma-70 family RNA polymerase sigma factor [Candidatus Sumerlaeaceae bacterium]